MSDDFLTGYSHRTVLVTGADGFVGSHLVKALLDRNARVTALVRRPTEQLKNLSSLKDRIQFTQADVCDYQQVRAALTPLQGVEGAIIFHLAAQAHVGDSWQAPELTLHTNVLGTLNLLQACVDLKLNLFRLDYAGSSEEYGSFDPARAEQYHRREGERVYLDESAPLNPKSVYAASKVAGDFLAKSYFDAYGLPVVVTRMFNNFGPRQNPTFITGAVITQALKSETVEIGWPYARRDFTYIDDGVRGHLLAALMGNAGETYVFGQGKNASIAQWVDLILRIGQEQKYWPERQVVMAPERYRPGKTDEADLLADATKLRLLTGWQPEVSWEEGLLRTIKWYAKSPK